MTEQKPMITFSKLDFKYNPIKDELTIEGNRYCGDLFRQLSTLFPLNTPFEIVKREKDGTIYLREFKTVILKNE